MRHIFKTRASVLQSLKGKLSIHGKVEYRKVRPEKDFEAAYIIFRETIKESVMGLNNGVWPEEERKPFFKKGFGDEGMSMLFHNGKPIGCFCIAELNLPFVDEGLIDLNTEKGIKDFTSRPTYKAAILQRMYIAPEYQNKGIGKALMSMALEHAHAKSLPLELEVLANNDIAIKAYKKYGYEPYSTVIKGWNEKHLMRQHTTDKYMPVSPKVKKVQKKSRKTTLKL